MVLKLRIVPDPQKGGVLVYASAKILILGRDTMLLETRRLLLTSAGFQVQTTTESLKTVTTLLDSEIDLFILCHTLTTRENEDALTIAHELRPKMKNLILSDDPPKKISISQDIVIDRFLNSEALISTVTKLTQPKFPKSGPANIESVIATQY